MSAFSRIGIISKPQDPRAAKALEHLLAFLERRHLTIIADASLGNLQCYGIDHIYSRRELAQSADLVIVVGGDGTLLHAARTVAEHDVPVLGVNVGRLGFLVDASPEHIDGQLDAIFAGEFHEERRAMLRGAVFRRGVEPVAHTALNDVVLHVREVVRMIEFETRIDDKVVHMSRADGIVVSTPTGSTAYALSCGGPLLHPELDALALVPIAPHTLSNRPIVVTGGSVIEIVLQPHSSSNALVAFDGQTSVEIDPGDHIVISKATKPLRLIHPRDYDYYAILRQKLRWSEQP